MEELSKKEPFKRNLSIGWSIWWRLWFLIQVVQIALSLSTKGWVVGWVGIVIFVGFPLADWAGKAVALKRYYVAIPSFIGWSIWWRGAVCSWILIPVTVLGTAFLVSAPVGQLYLYLFPFFCVYSGFFVLYLIALGSITHNFIIDKIPWQQKIEMGFGESPKKFPKNKEGYLK